MEKVKSPRQQYSEELKLTVLKDMYENNVSHLSVARKYGVSEACTYLWEKKYPVDSKLLSLSDQVITRVKAMQKDRKPTKKREEPLTREEQLVKEIENLRKALSMPVTLTDFTLVTCQLSLSWKAPDFIPRTNRLLFLFSTKSLRRYGVCFVGRRHRGVHIP